MPLSWAVVSPHSRETRSRCWCDMVSCLCWCEILSSGLRAAFTQKESLIRLQLCANHLLGPRLSIHLMCFCDLTKAIQPMKTSSESAVSDKWYNPIYNVLNSFPKEPEQERSKRKEKYQGLEVLGNHNLPILNHRVSAPIYSVSWCSAADGLSCRAVLSMLATITPAERQ